MNTPEPAEYIPARIHPRCGMLDDPAMNWPCPCRAWRESHPLPAPRRLPTLAEKRRERVGLASVAELIAGAAARGRGAA